MCLDEREAEARAALGAALAGVDAIEALRQTRQMFGRDAGPMVAHAQASGPARGRQRDVHERLAVFRGRSVFDGVLDEVFGDADEFVPVARDDQAFRSLEHQLRMAFLRHRGQRVDAMARHLDEVDGGAGPQMLLLLDMRQGQQIVDQPRHAPALIAHDREKPVPRHGVRAGRAL